MGPKEKPNTAATIHAINNYLNFLANGSVTDIKIVYNYLLNKKNLIEFIRNGSVFSESSRALPLAPFQSILNATNNGVVLYGDDMDRTWEWLEDIQDDTGSDETLEMDVDESQVSPDGSQYINTRKFIFIFIAFV